MAGMWCVQENWTFEIRHSLSGVHVLLYCLNSLDTKILLSSIKDDFRLFCFTRSRVFPSGSNNQQYFAYFVELDWKWFITVSNGSF